MLVRDRLKAGESDSQIRQYLVERYGEFILLKPRFATDTIILWGAPFLALLLSGFFVWRAAQRRGALSRSDAPLTDDEKAQLDRILADKS